MFMHLYKFKVNFHLQIELVHCICTEDYELSPTLPDIYQNNGLGMLDISLMQSLSPGREILMHVH